MNAPSPTPHATLDSQLAAFWTREAARLDALASGARFGWQRRRFSRKASLARAQAERSLAREAARGRPPDLSLG
jgi:hypothetical protein